MKDVDYGAEGFIFDSESHSLDYLRKHIEVEEDSCKDPRRQYMHANGSKEKEKLTIGDIIGIAAHISGDLKFYSDLKYLTLVPLLISPRMTAAV